MHLFDFEYSPLVFVIPCTIQARFLNCNYVIARTKIKQKALRKSRGQDMFSGRRLDYRACITPGLKFTLKI